MPTPASSMRSAATAGKPSGAAGSWEVSMQRMPQSPTWSTRTSGRPSRAVPGQVRTGSTSRAGPIRAL